MHALMCLLQCHLLRDTLHNPSVLSGCLCFPHIGDCLYHTNVVVILFCFIGELGFCLSLPLDSDSMRAGTLTAMLTSWYISVQHSPYIVNAQ